MQVVARGQLSAEYDPDTVTLNFCNQSVLNAVFVLCPEKWLSTIVAPAGDDGRITFALIIIVGLCDLCSLGGLILGIVKGDLPVPLGISYGVTTLAGVVPLLGVVSLGVCLVRGSAAV